MKTFKSAGKRAWVCLAAASLTVPLAVAGQARAASPGPAPMAIPVAPATVSTNLAEGRPARAANYFYEEMIKDPDVAAALAGVIAGANFGPSERAFDGSTATRWGSRYPHGVIGQWPADPITAGEAQAAWLDVELDGPQVIGRVEVAWEAGCATGYDIQVSDDGDNWTTVSSFDGPCEAGVRTHSFEALTATYVRMQGRTMKAIGNGYSIWELRVFAPWAWEPELPSTWPVDQGTNVSRLPGSVATATSQTMVPPLGRWMPVNGIDGILATRWSSDNEPDCTPKPCEYDPTNDWFQVTLPEAKPVHHINIYWEAALPSQFKLQISEDGESWTDVVRAVDPVPSARSTHVMAVDTPVRYVRMQGVARATAWGYSIYEFEIWDGPEAQPDAAGRVTPAPVSQVEAAGDPFVLG
ncbi:MAG: discoidin domain-containing protein, partial [Bifidobacteriaceae bacterium]|nr:discoidin domain-containing protein [Bifidobacteriaceae bacterium]